MQRRALILTEEQGTGGIQTTLGFLRQGLADHGWAVEHISVRADRPTAWALFHLARHTEVLIASNNFQPAYWAVLLGLLARRPVVVWVHGPLAEVLQHSGASPAKIGFLQGIYNLADALVFASRTAMDSLDRALPGALHAVRHVVHNPANPPGADSLNLAIAQRMDTATVQLGFVGRLSSEKRPAMLLQTLACLPKYCHLNIVGDGPLRAALELQVHNAPPEWGLAQRVHFEGEQAVTADTYRAWDATLLCSAYEGYPMVALESLSAGVPCIATPLPALKEMLQAEAAHWTAPQDTPQSLADTVLSSLQTPQGQRQALAQHIAQRHPARAFGQQWHDLLKTVTTMAALHGPQPKASAREGARWSGPSPQSKTVHFIQSGPAYMPELAAYEAELCRRGHTVQVHQDPATVPEHAHVVWWICGRISRPHTRRLARSLHVHEYASASVAPWPWLKDKVKALTHPRPDHRIFQSEWVRQRMGLTDTVPFSLRDMGVPAHFLKAQASDPAHFDLVYLGEMTRLLQFVPCLQAIHQAGLRLLLVGQIPDALQAVIGPLTHIHTSGRVAQADVPAQLLRARAGLNLVPNALPLSAQTSTKFLEYLAVGLPVISNASPWAERMALLHSPRVHIQHALTTPSAWQQALHELPLRLTDRQHLQALTWDAQLPTLPAWQALGL